MTDLKVSPRLERTAADDDNSEDERDEKLSSELWRQFDDGALPGNV